MISVQELHSLYRSPNIARVIKSRRISQVGHVARMEEGRSTFMILTCKPAGKRPLGRPRPRNEINIRIDLNEISINRRNCNDTTQDSHNQRALVYSALTFQVPQPCRRKTMATLLFDLYFQSRAHYNYLKLGHICRQILLAEILIVTQLSHMSDHSHLDYFKTEK